MPIRLKTLVHGCAAALLGLVIAAPVYATTLIGDTILIENLFPNVSSVNSGGAVVVAAGDADRQTFGGGSFAHADGMTLNFIMPNFTVFASGTEPGGAGNYIQFSDLDFDDGSTLTSVTLLSTFGGIVESDITFGSDFVRFDVAGLVPNAGDSVVIGLTTSTMAAIPLPAGAALLLTGVFALGFARRRTAN